MQIIKLILESKWFQNSIIFLILLSGILVGIETDFEFYHQNKKTLDFLNYLIIAIFSIEVILKILQEFPKPWNYFKDAWNVFDFTIVALALLPINSQYITVVRMLRLLRVLRILKISPHLQLLVSTLLKSIPSMGYVGLLLFLVFYVYAVAGVFLFGANDPIHFGTLSKAFLTLFQVVTMEGWVDIMNIESFGCNKFGYEGDLATLCVQSIASPISARIYFITFILLGTMIILNLFIGVIMNSMEEAQQETMNERLKKEHGSFSNALESEVINVEKELEDLKEHVHRITLLMKSKNK